MLSFKNVHSTVKPEERVETETMVDINSNIRQEESTDAMTKEKMVYWVYDTIRFESWQEYAQWLIENQKAEALDSQEAIGELSILQMMYQMQNEQAIAEITMLVAAAMGGE